MDGYVTKPIRRRELVAALSRVFGRDGEHVPLDVPPELEVNWEQVLRGLEGDCELLQTVLEACLEEVPRLNQKLANAVAARDNMASGRAAHAIKGALRILELHEPTARLETIEKAGRDGDVELVERESEQWLAAWPEIRAVVEAYVRSLRGAGV
jgi:HPt (histidine-containing phosphotransfer) domain-containing protein